MKFILISVAIIFKNNIAKIVGTDNVTTEFNQALGITWIKAILKQLKYPTHFTGLHTFEIALKYSYIPNIATIDINTSTIYLLPIKKIITTNGNPNNADVILFTSIFSLVLLSNLLQIFLFFFDIPQLLDLNLPL